MFSAVGEAEARVPGATPGNDEALLRVPGQAAVVCRGQGKQRGWEGGFADLPKLPDSSTLTVSFLQITFVDFIAYDVLERNQVFEPKCLEEFPNLKDFISRFEVMLLILFLLGWPSFPWQVLSPELK